MRRGSAHKRVHVCRHARAWEKLGACGVCDPLQTAACCCHAHVGRWDSSHHRLHPPQHLSCPVCPPNLGRSQYGLASPVSRVPPCPPSPQTPAMPRVLVVPPASWARASISCTLHWVCFTWSRPRGNGVTFLKHGNASRREGGNKPPQARGNKARVAGWKLRQRSEEVRSSGHRREGYLPAVWPCRVACHPQPL